MSLLHFASELGRYRSLTDEEITMLTSRGGLDKPPRRAWTAADDRALARMRRKRMTSEQIGDHMGRTLFSVRARIRYLNRRERAGA